MIFVTVGSTHFDPLIRKVDDLAQRGAIADDVLAQTGSGSYRPKAIRHLSYVNDIERYYREARLTICHGGTGTVFHLLQLGCPLIAVPNKDLAHDHQSDLLAALEAQNICAVCWDLADLERMVKRPIERRSYAPPAALAEEVWTYLCAASRKGAGGTGGA